MKKRKIICLFSLVAILGMTGCAANYSESGGTAKNTPPPEEPILTEITIIAGETVLDGVLFDNYTARTLRICCR